MDYYRNIGGLKECDHRRIASFRNYPRPSASDCRLIAQVRNIPRDRGSFLRASVSLFFSLCRLFGICSVPNDQSFLGPVMNSMRHTGRSFLATFLPRALPFGPSISLRINDAKYSLTSSLTLRPNNPFSARLNN